MFSRIRKINIESREKVSTQGYKSRTTREFKYEILGFIGRYTGLYSSMYYNTRKISTTVH